MNDKHLLAIGHDRNRSDSCITVWDVEKGLAKDSTQFMGLTETCHSLCWEKSSRILIAGMSQKNIKIFDLRRKFYRLLSFKPIFHIKNFNKLQQKKIQFSHRKHNLHFHNNKNSSWFVHSSKWLLSM